MSEFNSWQSYSTFKWSVKRNARYIFPPEVNEFLETVIATSENRRKHVAKGKIFWRAQIGHEWETFKTSYEGEDLENETIVPLSPERMRPMRDGAQEGRANPKGIPFLYLATNRETAMAEVRPWIGSSVSIGQFRTIKDLTLIDL